MSPEFQSLLAQRLRMWLFLVVALAAIPTYLTIHDRRIVHWLNTDSVQTTATAITYNNSLLKYSYTIGQRSYEGSEKTSTPFNPGDKFNVFVSASHPWISSLGKPPLTFEGGGYLAWFVLAVLIPSIALLASLRDEKSTLSGGSKPPNNRGSEFPEPPPRPQ